MLYDKTDGAVFVRKMHQSAPPAPPAWALRAHGCWQLPPFVRAHLRSIAQQGHLQERHCADGARKNHVRLITMTGFHNV